MNLTKIKWAMISTLVLFVSACGSSSLQNNNGKTNSVGRIQDDFRAIRVDAPSAPAASTTAAFGVDHYHVSISTSALGQQFLLQGSWIGLDYAPAFQGMRSKVVTFEQRGDQLVMLESPQGHVEHTDIPSTSVVATFPILNATNDEIVFDWAKGMSSLFISYDWYSSDFDGPYYTPDSMAVPVTSSFIEDAHMTPSSNTLVVRQISQINDLVFFGLEFKSNVETRYYLTPYSANPNFTPMKTPGFDRMGFFEINPQLIDGVDTVYVTKRDPQKPIVYAISANTPEEYKQSIRDAVLYWNKALGKNIVTVVDAPAGVSAPDPDYNLIQWVKWDDAGYSYADAQMDPYTGEILHSQIFMTSAFAFYGKQSVVQDIKTFDPADRKMSAKRRLPDLHKKDMKRADRINFLRHNAKPVRRLGLKGFVQTGLCFRDETQHIRDAYIKLRLNHATDAQILKASQDYVREVVAHEVGHTLGLRHNFAGSIGANFTPDQREKLFTDYIQNGKTDDGVVTTSSVMDYELFEESAMAGDIIAKGKDAFDYDHKAIDALYNGKQYANADVPFFCTDSDVMNYSDCMPFDTGKSPFAFNVQQIKDAERTLPAEVVAMFVAVKTDPQYSNMKLEDVYLDPFFESMEFAFPEINQLFDLDTDWSWILQVVKKFDSVNQWTWPDIQKQTGQYLSDQISANGGLTGLFPNMMAGYHAKFMAEVENLVHDTEFTTAMSRGPKPFSFSKEDSEKIIQLVSKGLESIEEAGSLWDLFISSFAQEFVPAGVDASGLVSSKAAAYVTNTSGIWFDEPVSYATLDGNGGYVEMKMPNFSYQLPTRLQATQWMSASGRASAASALNGIMTSGLGGVDPSAIDPSSLPDAAAAWLLQNQDLVSMLGKSNSSSSSGLDSDSSSDSDSDSRTHKHK